MVGTDREASHYRRWRAAEWSCVAKQAYKRNGLRGLMMLPETPQWCCSCTEKIPPKFRARFKLDGVFGQKLRKMVFLDRNFHMQGNVEEGKCSQLFSDFGRTQLFSPSSLGGVVSGAWTWVNKAWLAPSQTEMKFRTVHAISTKREKPQEGGEGQLNLRLWGVGFSGNPRRRDSEELPRVAV